MANGITYHCKEQPVSTCVDYTLINLLLFTEVSRDHLFVVKIGQLNNIHNIHIPYLLSHTVRNNVSHKSGMMPQFRTRLKNFVFIHHTILFRLVVCITKLIL